MSKGKYHRPEDCIGEMLRAIYGEVHHRYRIHLGTIPDDYLGQSCHASLSSIFSALKNHRGFSNFVNARYVDADFFIPNPGFIVECDESQHFTEPRKICLENYPKEKEVGFSKKQWISRCDLLDKHDHDPPSRDEQRAWYDTLRDFLPEIKGFLPTVRLYAGELNWCRMDPMNLDDIKKFQNHINSQRRIRLQTPINKLSNRYTKQNWVATVTLEMKSGKEPGLNPDRIKDLNIIVKNILKKVEGDGVIVFPAGFFNTGKEEIQCTFYNEISKQIQSILPENDDKIVIVTGIDGFQDAKKNDRDQVAIAVDKTNILSIARKHFLTEEDKKFGLRKSDFSSFECDKSRFFTLNGIRYYIAVCYDIHAGHNGGINNSQEFDVILNPIHKFAKGSGIADFVRKGMGLESRQWNCPVFGSVKFINDSTISDTWKAGVFWGFGPGITTRTPGTDTEKFAIPGKMIPLIKLPGGDQAAVELFTDILSNCNIMRENLKEFSETPSSRSRGKYLPIVHFKAYHPKFASIIETYKNMTGSNFKKGGTSSKENYLVKIKKTPPGVMYYFCYFPKDKKFSIEFTVNTTQAPQFESLIRDLKQKRFERLPDTHFWEQKTKDNTWLRLQFFYPEETPPQVVVQGIFDLIDQTYQQM